MRRAAGLRDGCRCAAATAHRRQLSSGSGASAAAAAKPPQLTDAASALKYCQQLTMYDLPSPVRLPAPAAARLT
jgi:hypothetical protein